jgi:hypothetical protein
MLVEFLALNALFEQQRQRVCSPCSCVEMLMPKVVALAVEVRMTWVMLGSVEQGTWRREK